MSLEDANHVAISHSKFLLPDLPILTSGSLRLKHNLALKASPLRKLNSSKTSPYLHRKSRRKFQTSPKEAPYDVSNLYNVPLFLSNVDSNSYLMLKSLEITSQHSYLDVCNSYLQLLMHHSYMSYFTAITF